MNLQPILNGPRMKLRPLAPEDFENLFQVASDPLIWEQHPDRLRYQREIFQKFFDSGISSRGCLVIQDSETNEFIGSSRFYEFSDLKKEVKIGFTFLAKKYWGGTFNHELKKLMMTHAFQYVDRILFDVGSENMRSRKALEKIGAKYLDQKEKTLPDGKKVISVTYVVYKSHKSDFNLK